MSVFEDLIGELKSENLLEDTVIDLNEADAAARPEQPLEFAREGAADELTAAAPAEPEDHSDLDLPQIEKPASEKEFFRKRAMDEVSSLQMVEHVLSGVEREHLQTSTAPFDDLNAKTALHKFLQVSGDLKSPEHAEAEYLLRQETEAWSFALFERDQNISVSHIRRFCEDSRPVLSSQALIALARFYRNSPYSEDVRGKFDYVMTRLFSRETGEETRTPLFAHNEMIGHINTLYANWSSIALYTNEDDQVEVSLAVINFDEFVVEIESAESFDEVLKSNFFGRIRKYKEESAEMFYVPEVVAAAIKCNLAIGNRYVALIGRERTDHTVEKIEEKYGADLDQVVSDAAGKTLLLADVLAIESGFNDEEAGTEAASQPLSPALSRSATKLAEPEDRSFDIFGINKWLMVFCVIGVLAAGSIYFFGEKVAGGDGTSAAVAKPLKIDDPDINKYLRSPRTTSETLYAVTQPEFDSLSEQEQKAVLGKVQKFANSRQLGKVNLINSKGRTVAFASKDRFELISQ